MSCRVQVKSNDLAFQAASHGWASAPAEKLEAIIQAVDKLALTGSQKSLVAKMRSMLKVKMADRL